MVSRNYPNHQSHFIPCSTNQSARQWMQTWPPTHRPQCIQCPIQKEDVTAAINKNHSSLFIQKEENWRGWLQGVPSHFINATGLCHAVPITAFHPSIVWRPSLTVISFLFPLFFCIFFFVLPHGKYFQSKQHPFKKSTAKMRWKWKKKRTRRLQRKRRKMRARAK